MSIPLISNIGFTEVNSAGVLNDKAGVNKSKLPIQLFKLTDNIDGNLQLNNDTSHKKIILDTNGKYIKNNTGSPLTNNSSINMELKGSGNVQCTQVQVSASETSSSFLGTKTISEANNSTLVVANVNTDTTVEKYIDVSGGLNYRGSTIDSSGTTTVGSGTPDASTIFGQGSSYFNTSGGTPVFIGDTAQGASSPVGQGYQLRVADIPPNTVSILRMDEYANIGLGGYFGNAGGHNRYSHQPSLHFISSGGSRRLWWRFIRAGNDRSFVFTNNLSIGCTLSGDVLNGDTATAGGTANANKSNTTNGSFSITINISGSNDSGQPFAFKSVNDGSGGVLTTDYTGTLSARAF